MISPTVGRVVWYRPSENDNRVAMAVRPSEQPLAAIVAFVFDDHLVNLTVFDHDGNSYARTSVQLVQEGDEIRAGTSYAQWMPYQVGQAKKHDAPSASITDPSHSITDHTAAHASIEQNISAKLEAAVGSIRSSLHERIEAVAAELNHQTFTRIEQLAKGLPNQEKLGEQQPGTQQQPASN